MDQLDLIQQQVEATIKHSQDYPFHVHAQELIQNWYKAKEPYIKLFHNELIYKVKHIDYTLSEQEKQSQFSSFLEHCQTEGVFHNNEGFKDFLLFNQEGFFDNKVVEPYTLLGIQKGMKLSRCFKYFIGDGWYLRQTQDAASRIMQANKFEGWLYLSVHPLDYLTIGENNHNWRSCHSLDGEFRAGNINYMVDDTTIVAYLASDRQEQLRCMPNGMLWNSKKWRMLVHTNNLESIIYYNRQYPFTHEMLLDDIHDALVRLEGGAHPQLLWTRPYPVGVREIVLGNNPHYRLNVNYIFSEREDFIPASQVINTDGYNGYNDLTYSPHYTPIVSYRRDSPYYQYRWFSKATSEEYLRYFHKTFDIAIGKKYKCLKCNNQWANESESFLCLDCIAEEDLDEDNFVVCACCGSRIYNINSDAYQVNGEYYCTECYMNLDTNKEEDNHG